MRPPPCAASDAASKMEDRAFNLRNIFNAYLEDETAVESVDYDFSKNPNRATAEERAMARATT